ncbi:uncharacterized protein TOL2_C12760 [Desulfobacula toluolica Tol2]|uniref:Uncharacterized protein n=1 Tax=Desulfobacula toluolica (strain DSM 7467 / Tol2) TaxID=651182 RepID=K0N5X6_DESTT|nr:uncharacterized protein TOL2_C12760 [Desulfobacula toluolica Tol2]
MVNQTGNFIAVFSHWPTLKFDQQTCLVTNPIFNRTINKNVKTTVNKGFQAIAALKVLKNSQKVLTTSIKPLLMRVSKAFYMDFSNLYIIRIKETAKTLNTLVNWGLKAIFKLKTNWNFYVLTSIKHYVLFFCNPLLIVLSGVCFRVSWLKHRKVFTCDLFTDYFSNAKLLHEGINSNYRYSRKEKILCTQTISSIYKQIRACKINLTGISRNFTRSPGITRDAFFFHAPIIPYLENPDKNYFDGWGGESNSF